MAKKSKGKFESKYAAFDKDKLDDLYYTNFLREIWSIPVSKIKSYIRQYYPNPTALELVEINDIFRVIKRSRKLSGALDEEDTKLIQYKHNRMYGKTRQVVEISGRGGGPIEYSDLSDEELQKVFNEKLDTLRNALNKVKAKG